MPFRPEPKQTVFVAIGLVILIGLGRWQLGRHWYKAELRETMEARVNGPPATAGELAADPADVAWRQGDLRGSFVGEPMLVTNVFEFGQPGYEVVQGFRVDGGEHLLVVRGWIPRDDRTAPLLTDLAARGQSQVKGLLLDLREDGYVEQGPITTSDGRVVWQPRSYPAMAKTLPEPAYGLVLVEGSPIADGQERAREPLPATGYRAKPKHVPHLEYMGQWWLIAATLFTIWVVAGFQRGKKLAANP